jgi:hypothetical protein
LRRLLAALFLLFFTLAPDEADGVGREAFIHDQIPRQRKTLPGEDRAFHRGRASPDTRILNAHSRILFHVSTITAEVVSGRLGRRGQGAVSPFHGVGLERITLRGRINLVASQASKTGPAVGCRHRLHTFFAVRAPG